MLFDVYFGIHSWGKMDRSGGWMRATGHRLIITAIGNSSLHGMSKWSASGNDRSNFILKNPLRYFCLCGHVVKQRGRPHTKTQSSEVNSGKNRRRLRFKHVKVCELFRGREPQSEVAVGCDVYPLILSLIDSSKPAFPGWRHDTHFVQNLMFQRRQAGVQQWRLRSPCWTDLGLDFNVSYSLSVCFTHQTYRRTHTHRERETEWKRDLTGEALRIYCISFNTLTHTHADTNVPEKLYESSLSQRWNLKQMFITNILLY